MIAPIKNALQNSIAKADAATNSESVVGNAITQPVNMDSTPIDINTLILFFIIHNLLLLVKKIVPEPELRQLTHALTACVHHSVSLYIIKKHFKTTYRSELPLPKLL